MDLRWVQIKTVRGLEVLETRVVYRRDGGRFSSKTQKLIYAVYS